MLEQEMVVIAEDDFNEMLLDIEFLEAAVELATEALADAGVDVNITEEDIWNHVKEKKDDDSTIN